MKLLNVDEWWVRELRVRGATHGAVGERLDQSRHPLLRLNPFLYGGLEPGIPLQLRDEIELCTTDYWVVELEKAAIPVTPRQDDTSTPALRADVVVLPSYMDFGMLCINTRHATERPNPRDRVDWLDWLDDLPRVWAHLDGGSGWFQRPDRSRKNQTVVDYLARAVHENPKRIGFSFDMETAVTSTCMFLELCWAFGATEEVFVRDLGPYLEGTLEKRKEFISNHPATLAIKFLEFLVVEGLMPPRTTLADAKRAVLSRLWYSSIPAVDPNSRPAVPITDTGITSEKEPPAAYSANVADDDAFSDTFNDIQKQSLSGMSDRP